MAPILEKSCPESCQALDRALVASTIAARNGNMAAVARALDVPRRDLRLMVRAEPELIDAALEIEERRLDRAEAVVRRAMRKGRLEDRLKAAAFIARMSAKW